MRGFSVESCQKYRLLHFLVPVIGHVQSALAKKSVTLVDAFAGPGQHADPELGHQPGSPRIMHTTAEMLNTDVRVVLIENNQATYDKLLRFTLELSTPAHVVTLPLLGDCADHIERIVDAADGDPVLLFADPCGSKLPKVFSRVCKEQHVTLLLRYSLTAAQRTNRLGKLRSQLAALKMPYWGFNASEIGTKYKYCFVLGTHSPQIMTACGRAVTPIASASMAVDEQLLLRAKPLPTPIHRSRIIPPGHSHNWVEIPAAQMAKMRKLIEGGMSYLAVAKKFDMSTSTVARRFKKPGTTKEVVSKGRAAPRKGNGNGKNWSAASAARTIKFTDNQIAQMKAAHRAGESYEEIAKRYKCAANTIMRRVTGSNQSTKKPTKPPAKPTDKQVAKKKKDPRYIEIPRATLVKVDGLRAAGESFATITKKLKLKVAPVTVERRWRESFT